MIGLDTNVLARYFAQDDAKQSALASRLIDGLSKDSPAFVSLVVLCELVWVMESGYALSKKQIVAILRQMLESDEMVIENKPLVWAAFGVFQKDALDFSDAIVLEAGKVAGCKHTVTFDKVASRTAGYVELKTK
jgi:predicted nucleic-acid-binding protein